SGRLELHRHHDARQPIAELVEADDTLVLGALGRLPRDQLVLALLGDPTFPLALAEPDLLLPGHAVVALLLDGEHAVHELREVVVLRPGLVRLVDGNGHVGPALNRQAPRLLASAVTAAARDVRYRVIGRHLISCPRNPRITFPGAA